MKRRPYLGVIVAVCMVLVSVPVGSAAGLSEVWVGDGSQANNYTTIAEAIDAVAEGGSIFVAAGTYAEEVVLDKAGVDIQSVEEHGAIIAGRVDIEANDVAINGFVIERQSDNGPSIRINADGARLTDNIIDGKDVPGSSTAVAGILVQYAGEVAISGNTIRNHTGNGIWVNAAGDLMIIGNTIFNNRTGLNFNNSQSDTATTEIIIAGNEFSGNSAHGLSIGSAGNLPSENFAIYENSFEDAGRTHFSDRRYGAKADTVLAPSREDFIAGNAFTGLYHWHWDADGLRWKLVPGLMTVVASAPGDYQFDSIQAAIDASDAGGEIIVMPGTYTEEISIDVPGLTLRSAEGRDATIIDADGGFAAIIAGANLGNVTVEGFTAQNWTAIGIGQSIHSREGTSFHVLHNSVLAPVETDTHGNSIQVAGDNSSVVGNSVTVPHQTSPDYSGSGILIATASNTVVRNNQVSGASSGDMGIAIHGGGIYDLPAAQGNLVQGNTIEGCKAGIMVQGDAFDTIIKENQILNNDVGLEVQSLADADLPAGINALYNVLTDNILGARVSGKDGGDLPTFDASANWWGSGDDPALQFDGDITCSSWALNEEFTSFATKQFVESAGEVELDDVNYIQVDPAVEGTLIFKRLPELLVEFPLSIIPGEPASIEIVIEKLADAPTAPPGFAYCCSAYRHNIQVDGTSLEQFSGPFKITFYYNPEAVENPDNLQIFWHNGATWEAIEGAVDRDNCSVSAEIDHWSDFVLLEEEDPSLPITGSAILWLVPGGVLLLLGGVLAFGKRRRARLE